MLKEYKIAWMVSLCLFIFSALKSQNSIYQISANLDTLRQTLDVKADLTINEKKYSNCDTLWFHLWANAYSNTNNSFTNEQLKFGFKSFYFRRDGELSSVSSLNIFSNGERIDYFYKDEENQILGILKPKSNIIKFEYTLKLPKLIDGIGYSKQGYWLRNFYPKLAWYDGKWITNNYLQYTESAEVPADIYLKLDGIKELLTFSNGQIDKKNESNIEAKNLKDLMVLLLKSEPDQLSSTIISNNKSITLNIIFLTKIKKSNWAIMDQMFEKVLNNLQTYCDTFPFEKITLIYGKNCESCFVSDGIYQIKYSDLENKESLESHLVSILSNIYVMKTLNVNGLQDSWLVDGISEYYYDRYYEEDNDQIGVVKQSFDFTDMNEYSKNRWIKPLKSNQKLLSYDQIFFNREILSKALLKLIESIIGKEDLDNSLRLLSNDKMIVTSDKLIDIIEATSGRILRPLIEKYLYDLKPIDYAIRRIDLKNGKLSINIDNYSIDSLPFILSVFDQNSEELKYLISPFTGQKYIDVDSFDLKKIKEISIDKLGLIPDFNRQNNFYYPNNSLKHGNIKLVSILKDDLPEYKELQFILYPAYNNNDGIMAGAILTNANYNSPKTLTYTFAPMYSFNNEKLLGQAWAKYSRYLESSTLERLELRLGIKSFDYDYNKKIDISKRYIRIDPTIRLLFEHSLVSGVTSDLTFKSYFIKEDGEKNSKIYKLDYAHQRKGTLSSSFTNIGLEQQSYQNENYLKISAIKKYRINYNKNKNIYLRLFASTFLINSQRESLSYQNKLSRGSVALIYQGFNDYTYDEYYFSRNNQNQLYDDQVSLDKGGGFKTPLGSSMGIGMSNNFAAAINFRADIPVLPKWLPLQAYFDIGTYSTFENNKFASNLLYNGGFTLNLKGCIAVHCPLVFSEELGNLYKEVHKNFFSRLSITMDLHKLNFLENDIPSNID